LSQGIPVFFSLLFVFQSSTPVTSAKFFAKHFDSRGEKKVSSAETLDRAALCPKKASPRPGDDISRFSFIKLRSETIDGIIKRLRSDDIEFELFYSCACGSLGACREFKAKKKLSTSITAGDDTE
jgi:hypothetical protein